MDNPGSEFWGIVKSNLMAKNSNNKLLETWFYPTQLMNVDQSTHATRFQLGVPSDLHRFWIHENILDRICSEISAIYNRPFDIELVVDDKLQSFSNGTSELHKAMSQPQTLPQPTQQPIYRQQPTSSSTSTTATRRDVLNIEYTFSTFVVGRNNEFAHAACYSIAQTPGTESYNPLFICGPSGMGKTHLLNSVGNFIRENNPHLRICYVSAERFLTECISSIRRQEMEKFRTRYRDKCDVLLMDDIQVLGRGEAVQEEFFHTLNDFFEKGQQVVVASDRIPKDIKGLEDRIRTRLEWGLIADIQMPDMETRVAILRYKAERKDMHIPDDVVNYIARISKRSIRELEGNLNKVRMFSELQGLEINLSLAKKVLASHGETSTLTVDDIQKMTADHFKVRVVDLKSKNRSKPLVTARQSAMYLIKKHLEKSLVDIGRYFGNRDHTTVLSAIRRIEKQLQENSDLVKDIDDLESRIHNITGV